MVHLCLKYASSQNDRSAIDNIISAFNSVSFAAFSIAYAQHTRKVDNAKLAQMSRHLARGVLDAQLCSAACRAGLELFESSPNAGSDAFRYQPVVSKRDYGVLPNRHFQLTADGHTCVFSIYRRPVLLTLCPSGPIQHQQLQRLAALSPVDWSLSYEMTSSFLRIFAAQRAVARDGPRAGK